MDFVKFDLYEGPSITTPEGDKVVPIVPLKRTWEDKNGKVWIGFFGLMTLFQVVRIDTASVNRLRSILFSFPSKWVHSFCQSSSLHFLFRILEGISLKIFYSSESPDWRWIMSSLYTSQKFLYDAMPSLEFVLCDILEYIGRSITGRSCPKSPNFFF